MLEWFRDNKDALIAVAALVSPVIAVIGGLISAVVSYRAVVTGPRIQRGIADRTFELTSRQLDLQARNIVLTGAQISANLLGAADQKWIEQFRDTVAEIQMCVVDYLTLSGQSPLIDSQMPYMMEIGRKIPLLRHKLRLMIEDDGTGEKFLESLAEFIRAKDAKTQGLTGGQMGYYAIIMIEEKRKKIASHIADAVAKAGR